MLTMKGVKYNAQHLSTLLDHMRSDFEVVKKHGQTFYRLKP